jgi:predicted acyltransferase
MGTTSNHLPQGRLISLDALRGLDMFFRVCLSYIFLALPEVSENALFTWLANQCEHPDWAGFTMYDIVFPMFIFIVGVAMPFSFAKRMTSEKGTKELYGHVFSRTITLMILGVVLWRSPGGPHPEYGYYSVLYRIGFSYFFAAIIMMNTGIKGQIYWAVGLFIGHWILMRFIPVPGYGMGDFSPQGNLDTYLGDLVARFISPNFRYVLDISLIPSVSNALFGVLAGHWLKSDHEPAQKAKWLLIVGILTIFAGLMVHMDFPINKKIGSPSFHLLTCGISTFLLGGFYWIMDVKGYKKWAFFLVVVGINPITIYVAAWLIDFNAISNVFIGRFELGRAQDLALVSVASLIKWLFLYYLYRQRIFLKI